MTTTPQTTIPVIDVDEHGGGPYIRWWGVCERDGKLYAGPTDVPYDGTAEQAIAEVSAVTAPYRGVAVARVHHPAYNIAPTPATVANVVLDAVSPVLGIPYAGV